MYPRTKELIEATFGDRLFINHGEAAKLLQVDRAELYRMGDDGEIGYQRKGSRRRRYNRECIEVYILNSTVAARIDPPPSKPGRTYEPRRSQAISHDDEHSKLQQRLERLKKKASEDEKARRRR